MATHESSDELTQLWESALAEYAKETTGKDKDALTLDTLLSNGKTITSTDALLVQIEASGQSFKDFRSKHDKLWGTLKLFVSPLTAVLNIAITPSSVAEFGIPVSAVLGACLHLIKVSRICFLASDFPSNSLLVGIGRLKTATELRKKYPRLSIGLSMSFSKCASSPSAWKYMLGERLIPC